jgi:hypothetical protein
VRQFKGQGHEFGQVTFRQCAKLCEQGVLQLLGVVVCIDGGAQLIQPLADDVGAGGVQWVGKGIDPLTPTLSPLQGARE